MTTPEPEHREHRHFDDDLALLNARLVEMARLAAARVDEAMRGLSAREQEPLTHVILGDEEINRFQIEIDDRCFKLLALHQPVAVDLRFVVTAVKVNADLERVGDLAVNIAEAARRYIQRPMAATHSDLPLMAELAQAMLRDALTALVNRDVVLAQDVLRRDDRVDELKNEIFRSLLGVMINDSQAIQPALDLVLISRHLERVGDHATNIA
jgi:phosphate transport system protein